jgi:hypothetical protein
MSLLSIWAAPWEWISSLFEVFRPHDISERVPKKNPNWEVGIIATFILNVMQSYVLPLLYGWVGATAYVMRRLISSVKERTYQNEHRVEYTLRTYLGILSGLAIGWFVGMNVGKEGIASLAPAAVSFLAGYSVEILFSVMDRLVGAFGSGATPAPRTPP